MTRLAVVGAGGAIAVVLGTGSGTPARGTIAFDSWTRDPNCDTEHESCPVRIYVVAASGGTPRLLVQRAGASPSWTPDGSAVAFSTPCGKRRYCIAVAKRDGRETRLLTHGLRDFAPRWSPSGERILFVRQRIVRGTLFTRLFVVAPSGGSARPVGRWQNADYPTWSPDGRSIVLTRTRYAISSEPQGSLYVIRADGTGARRLTSGRINDFDPAWSPGGRWIAFVRRDAATERSKGIFLIRPDGSGLHRLAPGDYISPAWSPDRRYLVVSVLDEGDAAHPNGGRSLRVIEVRSGRTWRLTAVGDIDESPSWSAR